MIERILGERPHTLTDYVATFTVAIAPVLAFHAVPTSGKILLLMLLPLAVLGVSYLKRPLGTFPIWQWAFIALLCLSVLWSDKAGYTSHELRSYAPLVLAVVVACSMMRPAQIIRALGLGFGLIVASSALTLLTDPRTHMRQGDFVLVAQFPKNTFGGILGVALVLAVAKPRRANVVVIPLLAVAIALNYSVTAWIVTTVVASASLGARWAATHLRRTSIGPVMLITVLVGAAAFALAVHLDSTSALDAVGKNSTLGTRTEIWAACWQQIKNAPLLGHGAFTFLDTASRSPVTLEIWSQFQGYQPPHPHNGFLDVWGQLGLVGLVAYFGMVLSALVYGTRMTLRGDASARAGTTCIVFLLMFGATEPAYIGAWLTVLLPCTIACTRSWVLRPREPRGRSLGHAESVEDVEDDVLVTTTPAQPGSKPPFLAQTS